MEDGGNKDWEQDGSDEETLLNPIFNSKASVLLIIDEDCYWNPVMAKRKHLDEFLAAIPGQNFPQCFAIPSQKFS